MSNNLICDTCGAEFPPIAGESTCENCTAHAEQEREQEFMESDEPEHREEHPSSAGHEDYLSWKHRRDQARREEREYE